jgi:hypothetical protein
MGSEIIMNRKKRLLIGVALGVVLIAASAENAVAVSGFLPRPGRTIAFRGGLRGERPGSRVPFFLECAVTLNGTFDSRLVRVTGEGSQVGSVTGVTSSECRELGFGRPSYRISGVLNLPWPITLQKLDGVNPRYAVASGLGVATVSIRRVSIQLTPFIEFFPPCLVGGEGEGFELRPVLLLVRGTEYSLFPVAEELYALRSNTAACNEFYGEGVLEGRYSLELPSSQTLQFLAGNEVREELTPNPVEFGVIAPEGLSQRSVVISSTRGGRIESLSVATGRYFSVTDPNSCNGRVLAEGSRCTINAIVVAPNETGLALSDTLTVVIAGRRMETTLRAST